jgi:hypothetical protein
VIGGLEESFQGTRSAWGDEAFQSHLGRESLLSQDLEMVPGWGSVELHSGSGALNPLEPFWRHLDSGTYPLLVICHQIDDPLQGSLGQYLGESYAKD